MNKKNTTEYTENYHSMMKKEVGRLKKRNSE